MLVKKHSFLFFIIFFFAIGQTAMSQCTTPINTFPYNEDFETTNGNWVRSSNTHWEWGQIISKPVINVAGGGTKCWLVGGFSGSNYNSGSSNLQSPCFDISGLSNPQVSFKVFWETERRFDGANFQYSIDGGNNWLVLGTINSNSNCTGENWFNYNPINFLGGPGWSGNIQPTSGSCQGGNGSSGWLTARHSLATIAGATGVIFRFVFAAGTTCNNFDGFAIDDVRIGEAAVNSADFTYSCTGNNAVAFTSSSSGCKTGVSWDFNDTGSGANNTSTLDNPTHTFSAPGNYNVTLTTNFVTGPSISVAKTIRIISISSFVTSLNACNGDQTASILISVSPAGTYNYAWDTNPPQSTTSISNLGAGVYTVVVTGSNTCSASLPVAITEPSVITIATTISAARCGSNNGSVTTVVSGGTTPYTYTWSNGASTPDINNLAAGSYSLLITDAQGCSANANNLQVNNVTGGITVNLGKDTSICPGQQVVLSPGSFASYQWQDGSASPTYPVTASGTYSVTVTDAAGCTGSASIKVTVDCSEIYFPSAFSPNKDGKNDLFGPLGNLASIRNYSLTVYGRWGQLVFSSTDPYLKWDGSYKGKDSETQVYTWAATYTIGNIAQQFQKGTVCVIR